MRTSPGLYQKNQRNITSSSSHYTIHAPHHLGGGTGGLGHGTRRISVAVPPYCNDDMIMIIPERRIRIQSQHCHLYIPKQHHHQKTRPSPNILTVENSGTGGDSGDDGRLRSASRSRSEHDVRMEQRYHGGAAAHKVLIKLDSQQSLSAKLSVLLRIADVHSRVLGAPLPLFWSKASPRPVS